MVIVRAKRWMMNQLFHSCLKPVQVFIRLISAPFSAGIRPNSDEV